MGAVSPGWERGGGGLRDVAGAALLICVRCFNTTCQMTTATARNTAGSSLNAVCLPNISTCWASSALWDQGVI